MKLHSPRLTRSVAVVATAAVALTALVACSSSADTTDKDTKKLNILMFNGQVETALSKLAAKNFTPKYGIKVNIKLLNENDLNNQVQQELANQAGQYDVVSVGGYNPVLYGDNGWLSPLNKYVLNDKKYDQADILPSVQKVLTGKGGNIYAEPTSTDTSLLMYNKSMFAAAGLTMPEHPTWQQVEDLAAKLKAANPNVAPICMRGQAGWSMLGSSLTTVVNTFGGTWFDKDWNAKVDAPGFKKATQFYVDLLQKYGPADSAANDVIACFNSFSSGKSAMWYDSSNAGAYLEPPSSPIHGNVGYVAAPTYKAGGKASGWLYSWALGVEKRSPNQTSAATFVKWATSKDVASLIGTTNGWAAAPPGQRTSLYENPEYVKAGAAFIPMTQWEFNHIDPSNPGAQPRPTTGVQYVAIPEFASLGTEITREVSNAIAGKQTVDQALEKGQQLAQQVGEKHKK